MQRGERADGSLSKLSVRLHFGRRFDPKRDRVIAAVSHRTRLGARSARKAPGVKRALLFLLVFAAAGATLEGDDSPQQAFVKMWQGRTVTVRSTLYSLIYNERGRLGTSRSGLRESLIVATPSQGAYFQFDGRQGRHEVVQTDLQRFVEAVNKAYEPDALDVRSYRKLEAVAINRYDPGVELVVTGVRVDPDQVRFQFARPDGEDVVTGIRVKWPVPLSRVFSERPLVEGLVQRFVEVKQN
jgi:hypothetical protein